MISTASCREREAVQVPPIHVVLVGGIVDFVIRHGHVSVEIDQLTKLLGEISAKVVLGLAGGRQISHQDAHPPRHLRLRFLLHERDHEKNRNHDGHIHPQTLALEHVPDSCLSAWDL